MQELLENGNSWFRGWWKEEIVWAKPFEASYYVQWLTGSNSSRKVMDITNTDSQVHTTSNSITKYWGALYWKHSCVLPYLMWDGRENMHPPFLPRNFEMRILKRPIVKQYSNHTYSPGPGFWWHVIFLSLQDWRCNSIYWCWIWSSSSKNSYFILHFFVILYCF